MIIHYQTDIVRKMDYEIDQALKLGKPKMLRIDLDDIEYRQFLHRVTDLVKEGKAEFRAGMPSRYFYRDIEVKEVK